MIFKSYSLWLSSCDPCLLNPTGYWTIDVGLPLIIYQRIKILLSYVPSHIVGEVRTLVVRVGHRGVVDVFEEERLATLHSLRKIC